jgi:VanZ family protein
VILRVSLVIVIIGIAYLSLTPSETIIVGNDKISHFIAYAVLMFNAGLITYKIKKSFYLSIILCLIYGALIEAGQHFVPGRFMSGYDMVANASGVMIGVVLTIILFKPVIRLLQSTRII